MIQFLKRTLRRRFPSALAGYHAYRQRRESNSHAMKITPFGFSLMGHGTMQEGVYEPHETTLIAQHLDHADVFIDIGANVGYYACLAARKARHVVAIEPDQANCEYLLRNLQANRLAGVEVFPVALAERPGVASLYGGGTGASIICGWAGNSEAWIRTIPVSTLDTLVGGRFEGQRLLIKMDVEGAEWRVLRGAAQTLERLPSPIWLMEVCLIEHHPSGIHPEFAAIFKLFWLHGYEVRTADKERRVVTPDDVARWVAHGSRDFGSINFVCARDGRGV